MVESQIPFCELTPFPLRSVALGGFMLLFLCCSGLFGNCLCLTSLIKRYLGDTVFRVYLYTLCVADSLTLACCLFMFVLPILIEYYQCDTDVQEIVNHLVLFFYPLGTFAESISTTLTATISLVRLVCVRFPLQTRMLKSRQTATSIIALMIVFVSLFHIPRLLELHISYCAVSVGNENRTLGMLAMTSLRQSPIYKTVYMAYGTTTVMFVVPFATILICNCATIFLLLQNRIYHRDVRHVVNQRHNMTSQLLIFLCFFFVFTHSLPFIINTLEATEVLRTGPKEETYGWLVDVSNCLVAFKASSNFLLYLMFNKKFRQAVWEDFKRKSMSTVFMSEILSRNRSSKVVSPDSVAIKE